MESVFWYEDGCMLGLVWNRNRGASLF